MSLPRRPSFPSRTSSSSAPPASISRMIFSPIVRLARRLSPLGLPSTLPTHPTTLILAVVAALQRLDLSRDPRKTIAKLAQHKFTLSQILQLLFMASCAVFSLIIMSAPIPFRIFLPLIYTLAILLPITSQFVWPATPIFAWLITYFCARFIPSQHRPTIHVALLPALESVLYGANISDLQTRYTNSVLDVIAWLPYGVLHFVVPFVVAAILWVWAPKGAVQYWGKAFGWMNLLGVVTQILFPCAAPWYEIIHGLTPANYSMPGSPGGLLRIDRVFHSSGYTNTFGGSPLVFGAFPSLHSGCGVMEALFLSHFFPSLKPCYWMYVGTLWWATMYLSHHYLIDLTGGACLSVMVFYVTMPTSFKDIDQIDWEAGAAVGISGGGYEVVNGHAIGEQLSNGGTSVEEFEREMAKLENEVADEETQIEAQGNSSSTADSQTLSVPAGMGGKKNKRTVSWGETRVLGEEEDEGDVGVSRS